MTEFFESHSGLSLDWKIECDALTKDDWDTLAFIVSENFSFKTVKGVPTGGWKFAEALRYYENENSTYHLIVDDVLTTGTSMDEALGMHIHQESVFGIVVFARGKCSKWITPIFQFGL